MSWKVCMRMSKMNIDGAVWLLCVGGTRGVHVSVVVLCSG